MRAQFSQENDARRSMISTDKQMRAKNVVSKGRKTKKNKEKAMSKPTLLEMLTKVQVELKALRVERRALLMEKIVVREEDIAAWRKSLVLRGKDTEMASE